MSGVFSPRFKSAAAMAGWDEEALLLASLVVEDTPDRISKTKKHFKSPKESSSNSRRRKRRVRPGSGSIPMVVLNLDDDDESSTNTVNKKDEEKGKIDIAKKVENETAREKVEEKSDKCSSSSTLACMDRLREELSCAICLDICYEPSTTPCGHSFCKNCLKSAADKCGKRCPKCRQLISNGRSCTVNTVLWNTIQLLFPEEVKAKKTALDSALESRVSDKRKKSLETVTSSSNQGNSSSNAVMSRRLRVSRRSADANFSTVRGVPNQDEDAALALRLQREEFMEIYRGSSLARDNLRAMARRAMNLSRNRIG